MNTSRTVFSPAKINLYLHITGARDDGYHELDSLVAFANIGDLLTIKKSDTDHIELKGLYAQHLAQSSSTKDNLVMRALKAVTPDQKYNIILQKNLPVTSGIGGGSANAAAAICAIYQLGLLPYEDLNAPELIQKLGEIGTDIPVSLRSEVTRMRGIGTELTAMPAMPQIPVVLVNPHVPCDTKAVFTAYDRNPKPVPTSLKPLVYNAQTSVEDFIEMLRSYANNLTETSLQIAPQISDVLSLLQGNNDCQLARMCGSGATCFGLFMDDARAQKAADKIAQENPTWWVQHGVLGFSGHECPVPLQTSP